MPEIQNLGLSVKAPGPIDYQLATPNQAFAQAGHEAAGISKVIDQYEEQDAAINGLKQLADFDAQSKARMQEMQGQQQTPDGFGAAWTQDWDQRADALIQSAPNPRVASFLQQHLAIGRDKALEDGFAWEAGQKEALQSTRFQQSVDQMASQIGTDPARFPEYLGALDHALDNGAFQPAKREALRLLGTQQLARSYVAGLPPEQALSQLKEGKLDSFIAPNDKISLTNQAESRLREQTTQDRVAEEKLQAYAGLQMQNAISDYANGFGNRPDLDDPAARAAMGDKNYLENAMRLSDADAKRQKSLGAMNAVVTALATDQKLNGNDPEIRKAADLHFQQTFLPVLDQIPPERRVDAIMGQINRYGLVPDSVATSMITVPLASGTPDQKAQAAQIYARLAQEQPAYAGGPAIRDDTRRTALLINSYREAGYSAEDAARAADADLKVEPKAQEALGAEYRRVNSNGESKPTKSQNYLQRQFAGAFWRSSPGLQAGLLAAFDTAVQHEYAANGGNLDLAQKAAFDKLQTQYGVSEVNGSPVVMRHAPEVFYGIPGLSRSQNAAWIRDQAVEDLNAGHPYQRVQSGQVRIVPYVTATGRAVTGPDGKPAYALTVIGPDGLPYPQMDYTPGSPNYGKPLAWVPDSERQTQEYNSATDLRLHYNLDVARLNQANANGTLQPGEYLQRKREILTKYGLNPNLTNSLESLSPLVRPKPDKRSENAPNQNNWTGRGGEDTGDDGGNDVAPASAGAPPPVTRDPNLEGQPNYGPHMVWSPTAKKWFQVDAAKPGFDVEGRPIPRETPATRKQREGDERQAAQELTAHPLPDFGIPEPRDQNSPETWASRGPGDTGAGQQVRPTERQALDAVQQSFDNINQVVAQVRQQQANLKTSGDESAADLKRRLNTAKTENEKYDALNNMVVRAETASPAMRREILKELDKRWSDADVWIKIAIARLHAIDARDRVVGAVVGDGTVKAVESRAPRGPL